MPKVSVRTTKISKGRHPMLKLGTLAHSLYTELKRHPEGLSYTALASMLSEKPQSVNGMLQRMKGEGIVISTQAQKGNRVITLYLLARGNENGNARDKIEIESTVYVNEYGEYSVRSRVIGQLVTATEDHPRMLHEFRHYVAVPRPNENFLTRQMPDPRALQPSANTKKPDVIVIDGEAEDITS